MYVLGLVALPLVLIVVFALSVRGDVESDNEELSDVLIARGIKSESEVPGPPISLFGVIDGIGVWVERGAFAPHDGLTVRASRNIGALFPRLARPVERAGYREGAEPGVPDPMLSAEAAENQAKTALEALTKSKVTISRDGEIVRIRVDGVECSRALLSRAVDAALALVDLAELAPPEKFGAPERGSERTLAFLVAAFGGFLIAVIAPSCSEPVRSALSPLSCREGETLSVSVGRARRHGTSYTLYCQSPDGESHSYGWATSFAAGFDACFPVIYLAALGVIIGRRRSRS